MKMKTMRDTLMEKYLLNNFLEEQAYHLSQNSSHDQKEILISPLEEFRGCEYVGRIVLHSAPWCFGPALGLTRRCQVGCWGWGSCRRQKQWGTGTPLPGGEGTLILNSWAVLTGPSFISWMVNTHFCAKDITLREIVLSERSEPLSYR